MPGCCNNEIEFDGQSPQYRRVLWTVIAINAVMFAVVIWLPSFCSVLKIN